MCRPRLPPLRPWTGRFKLESTCWMPSGAAITDAFQTSRGKVGAITYDLEQTPASDKSGKASELKDLNEAKAETYSVDWPDDKGVDSRQMTADQLADSFTSIMANRATLVAQRGDIDKPAKDAQTALDEYVKENLPGLGPPTWLACCRASRAWT